MMLKFFVLSVVTIIAVKCQLYDLEFRENGQTYKELITVDKQNKIAVYDVPKHGNRPAAKFLEDFKNRLTVYRDDVNSKCLVRRMDEDEPTPDSVVAGLKENNFKFPQNRYLVRNEYIVSIGQFDLSPYPIIARFCANRTVEETQKFDSVEEMEKALKSKLLSNHHGRTRRQATIKTYGVCTPAAAYSAMTNCARDFTKLALTCTVMQGRPCSWKVQCTTLYDSNGVMYHRCRNVGQHVFTLPYCCDAKCNI